jgi:diguanylate cyclase (GGDEF)-like protein/PAS domain S-box-containing protein
VSATAILAALPESCVITDAAHVIVSVNSAFTATTGYTSDAVLGRNCRFLQGPETDQDTVHAIGTALAAGGPFSGVLLNYRKNGEAFWNELSIAPLADAAGEIMGHIGAQRDVTERVLAQAHTTNLLAEAEAQQATLSALLRITRTLAGHTSTPTVLREVADAILTLCSADRSAIAMWDAAGCLSIAEVAGWEGRLKDTIRAFTLAPTDSPELAAIIALRQPVLVSRNDASDWGTAVLDEFELSCLAAVPVETGDHLTGLLIAGWATTPPPARLDPDLHARLAGLAGITATANETARLVDQVRWSATHDSLTGLANRDLLESELTAALGRTDGEAGLAVVFCDLDGFKRTNDSYGHAAGDRVLQEIASRLKAALRDSDLVARIGGDEFVILLTPIRSESEIDAVLRRLHHELEVPVEVGGVTVLTRLSTGVAHYTFRSPRPTAAALIRAADFDMYHRKGGRPAPPPRTPRPKQQSLQTDLAAAVALGQISALYQPQLDLRTGRIVAAEALVRWAHPTLGMLDPGQFIPFAEDTGVIHDVGRTMLSIACETAVEARRDHPELTMSVNVSRRELASSDYAENLEEILTRWGLPAPALTLEITESHLANDPLLLRAQAHALRGHGTGIALDDFGTGYTSIAQLQNIPITELKIDRSFVHQPPTPGADLVAGIIALAHELRLTVVAEGVETPAQLAHLRAIGCDRAQGYVISPPLAPDDFHRFIDQRQ